MTFHPVASQHAVRSSCASPRKRGLVVACALALLASSAVQAQEVTTPGDAATLDKVVVTGIRHSIETSVETKNESNSIVEAVSAEDIGKLPDISIADSISRLPGIATQRVDGRSQVINIRGMSEQFVGTLLNGREQVSTGDSRGVELDQYPAELINAVTVYKTPDAALIGQGLSGTVDLQSIRPLEYGQRRIVFNGSGEYNSYGKLSDDAKDNGYRVSASYVDQFADDTVGIAIGYARLDSPFQEKHYKAWWWADTDVWGAPQAGKPEGAVALQGSEGWIKSHDLTRDGVMGVVEFKPNETWHSILDLYYSKFDQDEVMHGAMWSNDPWFKDGQVSYSNAVVTDVSGFPVVTSGTLDGVQPVVRNDNNTRNDKLYAAGWANTFDWGTWSLLADLNYSKADRNQSTLETYAGLLDPQSIGFNLSGNPGFNHYSLPDLSDPSTVYLWDPQNWGHDGRLENSHQEDEIKAARLQLTHDIESSDFLRSYDVGVNFNRRTKEKVSQVYFADLLNDRAPVTVDPALLNSPTSLDFVGMGKLLSYNPRELLSRYYNVFISESNDDLRKDFTVDEDVDTYYFRANLDMDLTSRVRLRGNAGVQYVHTDQSSTGFNASGDAIVGAQTLGTSYGDILPSLNLVADFGEGWMVRFGAAREMMRPPINYLSADSSAGVSDITNEWSGSGGNPLLEPYRANAADISLEKYMGAASYVALALFYKDLDSYIFQDNIPWDFSGYDPDGKTPVSNFGTFYTWKNGTGGYMRGVELSTTLAGDLFSDALTGFGLQLSGSYTESSIDPDGPNLGSSTDTIPGLSKVVANATFYYENHGFAARISERYRDQYRGEYSSLFGQRQYRYTLSENSVDLQFSYDFAEGSPMSGLSLMFQVNNLNDEPFRTQVSEATGTGLLMPEEYTQYGRQYLIGFSYKM